ncbi:hypothetical protein TNCV_2039121 [Trichonephila clavipes]|nr:hypothetical protein TNCV_2039121 [Trichonephila clavipes]
MRTILKLCCVTTRDASELTDKDERDENEVNTGEIIVKCLKVRTGDSFQPEPSTSPSCSTTKSRKKAKRHKSFWIKNKSLHYTKWKTQQMETALKDKTPTELLV